MDTEEFDRKHPMTLVVLVTIIGVSLGGALYMMRQADARVSALDQSSADTVIPVDVYLAEPADMDRSIEVRGFLSGIEEVTVHSEVSGTLVERAIQAGAHVEAGQLLLRVDPTFYELRVLRAEAESTRAKGLLSQAQSGVEQSEAMLASAAAVLTNRQDDFNRVQRLFAKDNASQTEFDQVTTALRTAEADHAAAKAAVARGIDQKATAEAAVKVAQASGAEARAYLERCEVRSPISGRVNRIFLEEGEYAVSTAPLIEIIRLDKMKMIVELADTEVPLLNDFTHATVKADAVGDRPHPAHLHHVAPKMDPLSRKFHLELIVENPDELLLSGMYGAAKLYCGKQLQILSVPREAVFKHYGTDFCLVVDRSVESMQAKLRQVEVKPISGYLDRWEVIAGLTGGEEVIISQRRGLRHGTPIKIGRRLAADPMTVKAPTGIGRNPASPARADRNEPKLGG